MLQKNRDGRAPDALCDAARDDEAILILIPAPDMNRPGPEPPPHAFARISVFAPIDEDWHATVRALPDLTLSRCATHDAFRSQLTPGGLGIVHLPLTQSEAILSFAAGPVASRLVIVSELNYRTARAARNLPKAVELVWTDEILAELPRIVDNTLAASSSPRHLDELLGVESLPPMLAHALRQLRDAREPPHSVYAWARRSGVSERSLRHMLGSAFPELSAKQLVDWNTLLAVTWLRHHSGWSLDATCRRLRLARRTLERIAGRLTGAGLSVASLDLSGVLAMYGRWLDRHVPASGVRYSGSRHDAS